ncbi:MAG: hypothetical protein SF123_26250 [Chloroflexota bacterium]|nr:hypothetical protein [Chloroflexota bacterium]
MTIPEHLMIYTASAQQASETLRLRRELQLRKARIAGIWALGAFVIGVVASALLYNGHAAVPMFSEQGFVEWRSAAPFAAQSIAREIGLSFARVGEMLAMLIQSGGSGQIAAVARLLACGMIFVAVLFTYRRLLAEHYEVHGQSARRDDFQQRAATVGAVLRRVSVALAVLVSSYVALSLTWMLLASMFKEFSALYWSAAFFTGLFVALVTFGAVYWSLTVSTRHLMALGLVTFVVGLSGSFALAGIENNEQWWQAAVSRAGAHPDADWLFIATFGSVFLVFTALWFDVNQFIRLIVAQANVFHRLPAGDGLRARVQRYLHANTYGIIRTLYFAAVIGLLGVGFVQFNTSDISTVIAHTGGAFLAIVIFTVGGLVFAGWFPDPIFGVPFKRFSQLCVAVCAVSVILWLIGTLNLAGIELVCLVVIGVWFFVAIDSIVAYVNALT